MKFKFVVALTCIFLLNGCGISRSNDRFKVIAKANCGSIVYDTDTGVEYWLTNIHFSALTVMVDKEGKPLIYDKVERGNYSD